MTLICAFGSQAGADTEAERVPWMGRAALGPGWALFNGRAGDNRPHHHPALQLCIGHDAPVRVSLDEGSFEAPGILIGADVRHRLQAGPVWLLYIERQSSFGRRLEARGAPSVRSLDQQTCARLLGAWRTAAVPEHGVLNLIDELSGPEAAAPTNSGSLSRVRALIDALPALPTDQWDTDRLSRRVHLSPSRFAHAFRELAGIPVRPYLRWLRLAKALDAAANGNSLTEAAYRAGFADAAHFSRTMQRHFGISPSAVLTALRAHHEPPG